MHFDLKLLIPNPKLDNKIQTQKKTRKSIMNQEKIILLLTKFVEKLYTNFSYVYSQWFIYINRLRRHLKINAVNGINFIGKGEINRHNDFYRTQLHPSPSNKNNAIL